MAKKAAEKTATRVKLDPTAALRRVVENNQKGFLADQKNSQIEQAEGTLRDLTAKLAATVKELMPKCHLCKGLNIKIKRSVQHHRRPGPMIIGPGGRGQTWTTVHFEHLYCDDCGQTYYTDKIAAKMGNLVHQIQETEVKLQELRHPHLC